MYKLVSLQALSTSSPALSASTNHTLEPSKQNEAIAPPFREDANEADCSTVSIVPSLKEIALNAATGADADESLSLDALVKAADKEEDSCAALNSVSPFARVRRLPARALLRYLPPDADTDVASNAKSSSAAPAGSLALAAALRELSALAARESALGARGYVVDAPHTVAMCHRTLQVGSGPDCDLCLPQFGYCARISQHHATIFYDEVLSSRSSCAQLMQLFFTTGDCSSAQYN